MMKEEFINPAYKTVAPENESDGTKFGRNVFCPFASYGDCPYCDQMNICHIEDPVNDCDDFAAYYDIWEIYGKTGSIPVNTTKTTTNRR